MGDSDSGVQKPWGTYNIRERLLTAARELFDERGYQATTVEIAKRARVSEPTLFRHFGSKSGLFEATVAEPFLAFVQHWANDIPRYPAETSTDQIAREYVTTLLSFARDNRALLNVLVAAQSQPDSDLAAVAERVRSLITGTLQLLEQRTVPVARSRGAEGVDFSVAIPAELAMLIGLVLLEDWVFPSERARPADSEIVTEISKLLLHGLLHRDGHEA